MRSPRFLHLSSSLLLALSCSLACDGGDTSEGMGGETSGDSDSDSDATDSDPSGPDSDSSATDSDATDSNATDSDTTNSGDGDGDSGDGDGDSGDGDGDSGDGDGDSGDGDGDSGDGDGDSGLEAVLLLDSTVITEANNGGELRASCMLFEDGLPAANQPEFSYAIDPIEGAMEGGGSWSFEQFGTWTASCEAMVGNQLVSASDEISVLNDAVDDRLAQVGAALGASNNALAALLAADGGEDQALIDAITELAAVGPALADPDLDLAGLDDLLIPVPFGYPEANALTNAGINATADDDAYAAALTDINAAFDELAAFYASLDPMVEPTQQDLDALTDAGIEFDATLEAFGALEPTAHGVIASRETLAASIRDHLVPAMNAVNGYVVTRTQAEADQIFGLAPPNPGLTPKFGLLSLSLGMFNQSYLRVNLINKIYGDALAALDKSINNLILNDLIDYFLPPNPNGPIVDLMFASASQGFAVPGYDWWIYGDYFNADPNYNLVLVFGDNWQGVVDNILGACGVSEDNTAPENYKALNNCVNDIGDAVDSIFNTPIEIIDPGMLGGQDVHLGPFPEACEGWLPVATIIVPINLAVGRGESWLTNCLP